MEGIPRVELGRPTARRPNYPLEAKLSCRNPSVSMKKQLKSCGVLVSRGEPIESFLLMRHPNRWDLPKGHVDPGETDIECALRELEEETGIAGPDIELDPYFRFTTSYPVRYKRFNFEEMDKTLVVFWGCLQGDVSIHPTEHQDFEWIAWNPPHQIQPETIDPLLAELSAYLADADRGR